MWQRTLSHRWLDSSDEVASPLRVLIESNDGISQISDFSTFRMAGMDVAICSGPDAAGEECPLVRGEACRFADKADAVLVDLNLSRPEVRQVVAALVAHHPDTGIVVEVPRGGPDDIVALPDGTVALPSPASVSEQIRVLRRVALEARRRH